MPRYAMVIDQERCVGCQSCTVACKSEWDVPNGFGRTKVRQTGTIGTVSETLNIILCVAMQPLRPAHLCSSLPDRRNLSGSERHSPRESRSLHRLRLLCCRLSLRSTLHQRRNRQGGQVRFLRQPPG